MKTRFRHNSAPAREPQESGLKQMYERLEKLRKARAIEFSLASDSALLVWCVQTREALEQKRERELNYISRRASKHIHTPTDEAYESDQVLLEQVIAFLDMAIEKGKEAGYL